MSILKVNSCSIDRESGEIWTVQTNLQQIYPKSDSLLITQPGKIGYNNQYCYQFKRKGEINDDSFKGERYETTG